MPIEPRTINRYIHVCEKILLVDPNDHNPTLISMGYLKLGTSPIAPRYAFDLSALRLFSRLQLRGHTSMYTPSIVQTICGLGHRSVVTGTSRSSGPQAYPNLAIQVW